ncbi:glycogen/starch/alpha-glucan phosphorylase, partial [Vibrio cincinnatiensis]|uniref:glycogen/starch/alpha-glucan phosphorylase n=1 Tax=Vibrio cincinnatiensis TaxID=675 RepID=UPI0034D47F95
MVTEKIGDGWLKNLDEMRQIEKFVDDPEFCRRWREIKQNNKRNLAAYLLKYRNVQIDVNSLFDVQVKRIHEYKRQ